MTRDLADIRTDYARAGLAEGDVDGSPLRQLERWLTEAIDAGHPEPTAMTLATLGEDGFPAARVVLLKELDQGLVFFTNYESAKGRDLARTPRACACFFWVHLERQVRVTGTVAEIGREASEAYFRSRPRDSQLGAWASHQSAVLANRAALEERLAEAQARFDGAEVPCPPRWGGYRLTPHAIEFWQGRPNRLHDRLRYRFVAGSWTLERLSP